MKTPMTTKEQETKKEWMTKLGSGDFEKFVTQGAVLVDKTMLIRALLRDSSECMLITRPRRWGKTLNMSMLAYFFSPSLKRDGSPDEEKYAEKKAIFSKLKISAYPEIIQQYLGQYPTIFISFKGIKATTYSELEGDVRNLISQVYDSHRYLLHSPQLESDQKLLFQRFLTKSVDKSELKTSLQTLSAMLHAHFGKRVILLMDEYDTPLNERYANQLAQNKDFEENSAFVKDTLDLFKGLFGEALKDNKHLEKGVVTGILRLAKANLFSGLNNLREYTLLHEGLAEYFGFTESEVQELIMDERVDVSNKSELLKGVKDWYNGYCIGNYTIYNPWSIMNCLADQGALRAYWVNTANDDLIQNALGLDKYQQELQALVSGELLQVRVDPRMVFEDIKKSPDALWNLLLFSGYLTPVEAGKPAVGDIYICSVRIPNQEIKDVYNSSLIRWFTRQLNIGGSEYAAFLGDLLEGKMEKFEEKLKNYLQLISFFNAGEKKAESFYNGFIFGLIASVSHDYEIETEWETGRGRADVVLIPQATSQKEIALILEFKIADKTQDLSQVAHHALLQIEQKNYEAKIKAHLHVKKIIKIGMAFSEKNVSMAYR